MLAPSHRDAVLLRKIDVAAAAPPSFSDAVIPVSLKLQVTYFFPATPGSSLGMVDAVYRSWLMAPIAPALRVRSGSFVGLSAPIGAFGVQNDQLWVERLLGQYGLGKAEFQVLGFATDFIQPGLLLTEKPAYDG